MENPLRRVNYTNVKELYIQFKECCGLLWTNMVVQFHNCVEFFRVVANYYSNLSFAKVDFFLLLTYLFHNPFQISKRFLQRQEAEDIYVYGETPLTTLDIIRRETHISPQDTVFDLGCGRGRNCFWLSTYLGCKSVGIEHIPEFVERANAIKAKFGIENVEFREEDFLKTNFTGATVIYLYGTCLDEASIKAIIERFKALPAGTKIITVSYPLTDYASDSLFEVMKRFPVPYTWGTADIYLHIKK